MGLFAFVKRLTSSCVLNNLGRRSYLPWPVELTVGVGALLRYKIRTLESYHVPKKGGVILVANHLSYVDPVLLQIATSRPIRFMGFAAAKESSFFKTIFDLSGVISVSADKPTQGIKCALEALRRGECICLFPEGGISRTGQLMKIERGVEMIARKSGCPVIPVAHDGIWGSLFSFSGNTYLLKVPRLSRPSITIVFGKPIAAENLTVQKVRSELLDLGYVAFDNRPTLKANIGKQVALSLAKSPRKTVIIDRTAERRAISSAQLLGASAVLAKWLKTSVPEERVGVVLPPGMGAMVANLAIVWSGKSPVNLNFTAGKASNQAALKMSGVKTVITAEAMKSKVPDFPWPESTVDLRVLLSRKGVKKSIFLWMLSTWLLPRHLVVALLGLPTKADRSEAVLLLTSGSSGEPKGVVLSHRNLLANAEQISSLSILPHTRTILGCLPLFHSFGLTVTLWYPLLRGCGLVTVPSPLDTRRMIDAINEDEISVLVSAPTFLRPLLKKAHPSELKSLELVISGSEKLPHDLKQQFLKAFHLDILEGYGLTETSPVTSVNQPDPPVVTRTGSHQAGKKSGTVGRVMPGMTIRLIDPETNKEVACGTQGLIWLKGSNIFEGYLNNTERTSVSLVEGWYHTGDLGVLDKDGFLTISGRLSRFSKVGAEMVAHGLVEHTLTEILGLTDTEETMLVVVGVPDSARGEQLVMVTRLSITLEAVRSALAKTNLPHIAYPRRVVQVSAIPRLGSGKLDIAGCVMCAKE